MLEGIFVNRVGRGRAEKQRHLAPAKAFVGVQLVQTAGESLGGGGAAFLGVFAQPEMKFHERRLDFRAGWFLIVGAQRGKRHGIRPGGVLALAKDGSQQGVETVEQSLVGAEGQVEVDQLPARSPDIGPHLTEDGHVSVAEAIDRLFAVANNEEINRFSSFDC